MDSRVIAERVLQLGRTASGEGLVEGLTSAQWSVLRYFARANGYSRTPSAFAAFHGTTRGTVSQTIKHLEAQGYLTRQRSEADGRSVRLDLTDKARAILASDLFEILVRAADALPAGVRGHLGSALERMFGQVAWERGQPVFGTCPTCTHLQGDGCCHDGKAAFTCALANAAVGPDQFDELCIHFTPGKPLAMTDAGTGGASR